MSQSLQFKAFCIEAYRAEKGLSGRDAMELFEKYGVTEYLNTFYDVLHTLGRDYLIEDIDRFIAARA